MRHLKHSEGYCILLDASLSSKNILDLLEIALNKDRPDDELLKLAKERLEIFYLNCNENLRRLYDEECEHAYGKGW